MLYRTLITVISLLILFSFSSAAVAPWEIDEIMGKEAPKFTLRKLSDVKVSLSSFKGKVILINFWATWCRPCKVEMPVLNKLFHKLKDRGFTVLGVSIDRSKKPVQKFLDKIPLDFPILLDSDIDVSRKYKVTRYPTTFIIDREGILREKFFGGKDWMDPEIIKLIEGYLEK
jgi:peroxiredoxin